MARRSPTWRLVGLCLVLAAAGCMRTPPPLPPSEPPPVEVSRPVVREVVDFNEYTGQTEAVESVVVRPRVYGYLNKVNFTDGDMVTAEDIEKAQKGEPSKALLFEIDPQTYRAEYDQTVAQIKLAETQLKLAQAEEARTRALTRTGAAPQEELEQRVAARAVAAEQV